MTNYEYLISLTPEQIAQQFYDGEWCGTPPPNSCIHDCKRCILEWLKSERKEDENA